MKKIIIVILGSMLGFQAVFAADLVEVYCEAVKCDATLNAAIADLMANRENIPISRSALLPRLDIHADVERERIALQGLSFASLVSTGIFIPINISQVFYNSSANYYLKLTQPVFNYSNWARVRQSKASVQAAEANFCSIAQNLMVRVVRAYFDVLIADADLSYTKLYIKDVAEQLRQTQAQFDVGTAAITNVLEAQAAYDVAVAQEVTDRYNLAIRIEALRVITNNMYCSLQALGVALPKVTPNPCDIQEWVCTAEKQNYDLQAARYNAQAARENIKVQSGGKLPVINAFGQYTYNYNSNLQGIDFLTRQKTVEGGIELDWAPIQGGGIIARTDQAAYLFKEACQRQELTHRQVVSNTRNAYLGIFAGISKVTADHSSIISGGRSVTATTDSYKVGTRTILDVLNQRIQLYNVQRNYVQDRYEYIYQTILLKQATGTLCVSDLQYINAWLCSHVDISKTDALLEGCACASTLQPLTTKTSLVPKQQITPITGCNTAPNTSQNSGPATNQVSSITCGTPTPAKAQNMRPSLTPSPQPSPASGRGGKMN
jgi:outer membrane protein